MVPVASSPAGSQQPLRFDALGASRPAVSNLSMLVTDGLIGSIRNRALSAWASRCQSQPCSRAPATGPVPRISSRIGSRSRFCRKCVASLQSTVATDYSSWRTIILSEMIPSMADTQKLQLTEAPNPTLHRTTPGVTDAASSTSRAAAAPPSAVAELVSAGL